MSILNLQTIKVGTRVSTNLYNSGMGTVYRITGEQEPETVRSIGGGIGYSGGNAQFDIVFDCGKFSDKLSECILRGIQWKIYPDVFSPFDVESAVAKGKALSALANAELYAKQKMFELETQRLVLDPTYSHLQRGEDKYSGKLAGVNIRLELKRAFPGVKFSVRKYYYGCLAVEWTDGPTEDQVNEIIRRYKYGSYNGMEDLYEKDIQPFNVIFGGVQFLHVNRSTSPELANIAIDRIVAKAPEFFSTIHALTGEMFKSGALYCIRVPGFDDNLQSIVSKELRTIAG